jgi:CBS domain-containing protein
MQITDRISSIMSGKSGEIWTIPTDASVYSAIELMADKGIGALLVMEDGRLAGILSERDYARKVILKGRHSTDTFVREIMTESPITIGLNCTVDEAMHLITEHRVRHLPVVDQGRVVGVLSIGDLVKWIITSQEQTIEHLQKYIAGQ